MTSFYFAISQMKPSNEKYTNTQRRILNYFSSVRGMFKRGTIRFRSEKKSIMLTYHQANLQGGISAEASIPYDIQTNQDKRGTVRLVQDFIISCYYEFERDKKPMKLKHLACLCGIGISRINEQLENITQKFHVYFTPQK